MRRVVIIGAGLAGLGAARALRKKSGEYSVTLLEKEDRPGGLCRTAQQDGFFFDQTGHLLHFRTKEFKRLVTRRLLPGLVERQRNSWVYSHNVYTRYPFQANLHGLPAEVVTECLYGFCEAYFRPRKRPVVSFEDWIMAYFGPGIAKNFMIPYNTKLYQRHPSDLTPDCAGRFVPRPDLSQVIRGAVADSGERLGYNASFYYPREGGIESLVKAIARGVRGLSTQREVRAIDLGRRFVTTDTGEVYDFDFLISSAPLPDLVRMFAEAPPSVRKAAESLECVSVLNINLGIRGSISDKHWIYIPEDRFSFYRIGFAHNFADSMAPAGCSSIYVEVSHPPGRSLNTGRVVEKVVSDLVAMKVIQSEEDVITRMAIDIPYAYVIFNRARKPALGVIGRFLAKNRVFPIGRYGRWEYQSMEDAFLDGTATAAGLEEQKK